MIMIYSYIGREDDRRKEFLDYIKSLHNISIGVFGQTKKNLLIGGHYYEMIQKQKLLLIIVVLMILSYILPIGLFS